MALSAMPLWLICVITFGAVLGLALVALTAIGGKSDRVTRQARLDEVHRYRLLGAYSDRAVATERPAEQTALTTQLLAVVDRSLESGDRRERLTGQLERSGMRMRPAEWMATQIVATVGLGLAGAFLLSVFALPIGGLLGWLGCRLVMSRKIAKRAAAFEEQLPDALQLLAGALRSGFALNQALGAVVREGTEPVASELGRAMQEVRLGATLEDALAATAERMDSNDMRLVVMSIRTAREVGGNLAEVLMTTAYTMRERVQLRGQVQVLSAEGRISAKVLIGLPILLSGYLFAFRRAYFAILYTTGPGIAMLVIGIGLLVTGGFWLNRLTKIEV
jgi:tight adherence protein B